MKILLSEIIIEVSERVWENQTIENFWVNNKTGLEKSDRRVSEDISNYKIIRHNYFAYNPYRINVWSIGLFDWELWAVSPAYVVFKVDEKKILPSLLLNFLKSQRWLVEINQHTHGWVRKSLSISDLWKIEIDIPDIEKQKEFVDLSIKNSSIIKKIEFVNSDNQDLVKRLRQSILQDAIQGKLVPQDPNDEPASELLKKIKAEKDQLIKEKKIKKSKDLAPIMDNEISFDLPKGWEWVRLGEICTKITDWFHNTPKKLNEWYKYVSATHIRENCIDRKNCLFVWKKDFEELYKKTYPKKWEILITNRWAWCWTPSIIDIDDEFTFQNAALIWFNQSLLNNRYIYWYLLNFRSQLMDEFVRWWAQPMLSNIILWDVILPLPPVVEQHRIVAKVDELMKYCDWLEIQITEAKENGEKLMESVLGEVFR